MMKNDARDNLRTVVMAGMPQTGKSTFLGALYHVLETGGDQPVTLEILPKARQHLEGLRERWLRVEKEGRTPREITSMNELCLQFSDGARSLVLRWPDLSGEYFDDMVRKRLVDGHVASIIQDATAVLIFVHPDTVTLQPRIHEVERLANAVSPGEEDRDEGGQGGEVAGHREKEWDAMMVPGQILVVDLVQLLLASLLGAAIRKISVVVSAWDMVSEHFGSPKAYVGDQLPLLAQFVNANSDIYEFRIFGVSALGGDPETDKAQLQAEIDPVQRIKTVCEDGIDAKDGILSPLLWLIK